MDEKQLNPRYNPEWLASFRWAMFASLLFACGYVYLFQPDSLSSKSSLTVSLTVVAALLCFFPLLNWFQRRWPMGSVAFALTVLTFDCLLLTGVFHFTGGTHNPFTILYLAQITLSLIVLGLLPSLLVLIAANLGFLSLFIFQEDSHIHHHGVASGHLEGMFVAFILTSLLISFFLHRLSSQFAVFSAERDRMKKLREEQLRMATITAVTSQSAHELASPLSKISLSAGDALHLLDGSGSRDEIRVELQKVKGQTQVAKSLLNRMALEGANEITMELSTVSLQSFSEDLIASLPEEHREITDLNLIDLDRRLTLPFDALKRSIHSLVKNSVQAEATKVDLQIRADENVLSIIVTDNGKGMTPELMARIAEPFMSSKSLGEGLGLGTFVLKLLCETLDGTLLFKANSSDQTTPGITVSIELPLSNVAIQKRHPKGLAA